VQVPYVHILEQTSSPPILGIASDFARDAAFSVADISYLFLSFRNESYFCPCKKLN